ncbi:hypothetical protein ZWY2020_050949 [Hordeum vulgare]|nr:hypothetical protein ZWY2020_050949 [Hordeum vulgare]
MDERRRPLPSAADASMESRKRSVASKCASRDSPSTAAQPAPLLQLSPQKRARVDETICDVGDARSGVVEVNEGYEEVNEADEYDRDDDMSDPSLGLGDKENDVEGEVNDTEKRKRGKRNKAKVDVGNKVKEDDIDDDVEFIPFPESMGGQIGKSQLSGFPYIVVVLLLIVCLCGFLASPARASLIKKERFCPLRACI